MRTVTIDYPVIGWATTTLEVEDDESIASIRAAIESDEIEILFHPSDAMSLTPYLSLEDAVRDVTDGASEVPYELTITDD